MDLKNVFSGWLAYICRTVFAFAWLICICWLAYIDWMLNCWLTFIGLYLYLQIDLHLLIGLHWLPMKIPRSIYSFVSSSYRHGACIRDKAECKTGITFHMWFDDAGAALCLGSTAPLSGFSKKRVFSETTGSETRIQAFDPTCVMKPGHFQQILEARISTRPFQACINSFKHSTCCCTVFFNNAHVYYITEYTFLFCKVFIKHRHWLSEMSAFLESAFLSRVC